MTATHAWPAAVAAGRRRDYSTVLAPDVLADGYGVLVEVLSPGPVGGPPRMRTLGGGRFTVAYVTHALTTADLGEEGAERPLRDEQSRPLLMMYGLVRAGTTSTPPRQSDLDGARRVALAAYRHFLAGEEAFRALTSRAVPVDWPGASAAQPPAPGRRFGRAGVVAGALLVLVALVGWFFLRSGGEPNPCAPATAVVVASPAPATCPPTTGPPRR
ncbi:hypothetical protein DFJ67_5929 [Asanoa ferruginea]|uniref:Uncharacterized protein n=1 Tax=Asanoa ferruginea TaxID=53367 RepID=A0A3D9ZRN1_9ACTN|nr:hypothetical protein [Asanoa ferruginea]REF99885.1 hypothetical protein DFJ67_5929 [Asanoa ferruginea]GIF51656.1 hypothetical protein Afe04nite_61950 [Asanoa ferruginea]